MTQYADGMASSNTYGFRNKIIGGDFTTNPWQRGTSFTALATGAYGVDRWRANHVSDAVVNWLKTADAPTAAEAGVFTQHCLHLDVTTADTSIGASQQYSLDHFIEGLNAASFGFGQAGTRYVTLSFWHKHTKTGVYCVAIRNGAGDRSYVIEYTQDITNTWEKATATIPVDTSGTWLYDTGRGVHVMFSLAVGTNFQSAANTWTTGSYLATSNQVNALDSISNDFKLALIQLEAGSVATPFEARDVGDVLRQCQRYYYRIFPGVVSAVLGNAQCWTTAATIGHISFPTVMRTAPTALEQSNTASQYAVTHAGTVTQCNGVPGFNAANMYGASVTFNTAAVLTAGRAANMVTDATNGASAYLGWSAEL